MEAIQIGDMIPDFSLKDQDGNMIDINDYRGKKKLVIFFYPMDGLLGCVTEANYFRDLLEEFDEVDAVIIGISGQTVESHKDFATKYRLNYPILSDQENKVRKLFGVPSSALGLIPGRVSYVANDKGKVIHFFNSQLKPKRHADEALKILLVLKKADTLQGEVHSTN
jgi:thioredoxin-dependent peroxiredoxin